MVLPRGISFRASFGTTPMPAGLTCRSTLRSTFTPNGAAPRAYGSSPFRAMYQNV